jgi:hypothetical protein
MAASSSAVKVPSDPFRSDGFDWAMSQSAIRSRILPNSGHVIDCLASAVASTVLPSDARSVLLRSISAT